MSDLRYLLDTNICIYLLEGRSEPARRRLEQCEIGEVGTSAIVHGEVMIGVRDPIAAASAEQFFSMVAVQPFDMEASRAYAQLRFKRTNFDKLIAAHALSLGLTLVTNNEHDFAEIPGLTVENWTR